MILILSQDYNEATTEEVMDWLELSGCPVVRMNGSDLEHGIEIAIFIGETTTVNIVLQNLHLEIDQIRAVWFRRWEYEPKAETIKLVASKRRGHRRAELNLRNYLRLDRQRLSEFFFSRFSNIPWLGSPSNRRQNKLLTLAKALESGLEIPKTLLTTKKSELLKFYSKCSGIITKSISEAEIFHLGTQVYTTYTTEISRELIENTFEEDFPPSLFQEKLYKLYDLRVFFLGGECFPMAIFSQKDPQTEIDFRRYNLERPNRCVPYRLLPDMVERINKLMNHLKLETGSLDFVRTVDGRTVFLEVNPVGQFGMISKPCNYQLERKVAEHLAKKAYMSCPEKMMVYC